MIYEKRLQELKQIISKIEYIQYTLNGLMYWDKVTYMPKGSIEYRSKVMSFLGDELYHMLIDRAFIKYINYFSDNPKNDYVTDAMIKRIKRNSYFVNKVPEEQYGRYIELIAVSEQVWEEAKKQNDFSVFAPYLEKIIETFTDFAEYWGYEENPYDALMSYYEDGLTVKIIDGFIEKLKPVLIDILKNTSNTNDEEDVTVQLDDEKQKELWQEILSDFGFSFEYGRVDIGVHPTVLTNSPYDVRIVNAYDKDDVQAGISNVLHSCGKGIYAQSVDKSLMGTFLAGAPSFMMEEVIGRLYENILGKSRGFSDYLFDKICKKKPDMKNITKNSFYQSMNKFNISPLRFKADEVSYLLHIVIRYELERDLINGKIKVSDLQEQWNKKYYEYLGVIPESDSEGILQDIQWAAGYVGYFPCYFIANLMSVQFAVTMEKDIGEIDALFKENKMNLIIKWLKEKVFEHGAVYSSKELLTSVTGEKLNPEYYISYLLRKYS